MQSTALAVAGGDLDVHTGVYLLPLRHPVTVARQIATLAQLAPGRFVFGCGIGGEDRAEVLACGIDPATRAERMDESLHVLSRAARRGKGDLPRRLLRPSRRRRPADRLPSRCRDRRRAVRRWRCAARAATATAGSGCGSRPVATRLQWNHAGRRGASRHRGRLEAGLHWSGARFGAAREAAAARSRGDRAGFYGVSFERFDRYTPRGTPQDVAEFVLPYVAAGCHDIHLLPVAHDDDEAIDGCGAVRQLVLAELGVPEPAGQGKDGRG